MRAILVAALLLAAPACDAATMTQPAPELIYKIATRAVADTARASGTFTMPMFGSMVMHLEGQCRARLYHDALHLKSLAGIDDRPT